MYPAKPQNCKQRDHKKRSSPTTKVGLDPFFLFTPRFRVVFVSQRWWPSITHLILNADTNRPVAGIVDLTNLSFNDFDSPGNGPYRISHAQIDDQIRLAF